MPIEDQATRPPLDEALYSRVITRDQAASSRSPEIRDALCHMFFMDTREWWGIGGGFSSGCPPHDRRVEIVSDAAVLCNRDNLFYILRDMTTPPATPTEVVNSLPEAPKRKSNITTLVGGQLVSMLKSAPSNATFLAMLMAKVGEQPPADADTYEKIKDWVEFNFPKGTKAATTKATVVWSGRAVAHSHESGRCRFSRAMKGEFVFKISKSELDTIVGDEGHIDDIRARVFDLIREKAEGEMYEVDANYEDHEVDDSEGIDLDVDGHRAMDRAITQFVVDHYDTYGIGGLGE